MPSGITRYANFFYFCNPIALVAELVDALDSKSSDFGRVGSIPTQGTQEKAGICLSFFYSQVQHLSIFYLSFLDIN